jgi:hypothetical protein
VDPENAAGMTAKLLCTADDGRAHLKEFGQLGVCVSSGIS